MTRVPNLVVFVCEICGHEVATFPNATVWCVRRWQHPPRTGPVVMRHKEDIQ